MRRLQLLTISLLIIASFLMIGCKGSPQQNTTETAEPSSTEQAEDTDSDDDGAVATEEEDSDAREESQPIVRSNAPGVVVMDANVHNPVGVSWSPDGTRIAI